MKEAFIITDLSFGDAGKGTIVDYLSRQKDRVAIIRHNGGPQAAHNVVTPDGRHHTFAQFGSGSFVPGVQTHLSRDMLVNPLAMYPEAEHLRELGVDDVWSRLTVDAGARIITPWQVAVNRLRERARGEGRHGSCAHGVGETMADDLERPALTVYAGDLSKAGLEKRLNAVRKYKYQQALREIGGADSSDEWECLRSGAAVGEVAEVFSIWARHVRIALGHLAVLADEADTLIFEGAQGVLLDEWYGFHPYTTWSTTTPENARRLLCDIGYNEPVTTLGLVRAYTTRHGPGPFPTEDPALASKLAEHHNGTGEWQGAFRYGHFDTVAHRYAIRVSQGVDALAVTCLDRVRRLKQWRSCEAYETPVHGTDDLFRDGGKNIAVGEKGDLEYQGRLTEALFGCEPRYTVLNNPDTTNVVEAIETGLGVPVRILSSGQTADDKRLVETGREGLELG